MATNWLTRTARRWLGHDSDMQAPQDVRAEFRLVHVTSDAKDGLLVGTLSIENGVWSFAYSDEFRAQPQLRPIVEFLDVNRTYRSEELWPFFALRIPSLKQAAIDEAIRRESIDRTDEVQLLRRFGQRTISNPFQLIPQ